MSINQTPISKTRSNLSLITLNSCEATLTVPSLSVKSSLSVKRLSRRDCRKLFKKRVFQSKISTIPTIHQYQQAQKRTQSADWYNQSQFKDLSSSSYSSKTTNSSVKRLINRVESSKGQTQTFYRKKKNKNSYIKRICTPYSWMCLCLCPLVLTILGAFIAAVVLFTKLPTETSTTTLTTSITTVATTIVTTGTTVATTVTTTGTTAATTIVTTGTTVATATVTTTITSTATIITTMTTSTNSASTTTETTTTTGVPTCSTCMVTYTNNYAVPIGNRSCNDACQTTDYYKSASIKFPSISSSCNTVLTASANGTFCAYYSANYYSTNNIITYYGSSYGTYPNGPYSGVGYFTSYLAHCIDNNNYYCCCT